VAQSAISAGPHCVPNLTINGLLLRYLDFAENYYIDECGRATGELEQMKQALRPLRKLYGRSLAAEFGPLALKAVRQHLVDEKRLSRNVINRRMNRIRRAIRWAVSEQLNPPSVYEGLRSVDPLKYGRTTAHESPPVKPAPQAAVDAVVAVVSPQVAAMIQIQQLAAMRPSEVVQMQLCDINQDGEVWIYQPWKHKTRWRDQDRRICLGKKAQAVLRPFMTRDPEAYLFSPREAEQWRAEQRRRKRRTPLTPSQRQRKPKRNPQRAKRDHYDRHSYARAITYAISRVNHARQQAGLPPIEHWCPLQLRHSGASEIRKRYGLEGAQVVLGHKRADVTQVYAERQSELGLQIAREVG
jgi:integrase